MLGVGLLGVKGFERRRGGGGRELFVAEWGRWRWGGGSLLLRGWGGEILYTGEGVGLANHFESRLDVLMSGQLAFDTLR